MTDFDAPDVSGTAPEIDYNQGTGPDTSGSTGNDNPAWKSFMDVLPTSLHETVKPVLRDWDKNYQGVQQQYSEVQSKFSPYADIIEGADPEQLQSAMMIAQMIESDPRSFYDSMGDYYKDEWGQGQQGQVDDGDEEFSISDPNHPDFDITQHPKFQELMGNQQTMAEYLAGNIQQQQEAEAEADIDEEWNAAQEKHGNALDEQSVFSLALGNKISIEQAADYYMQNVNKIRSQPRANGTAPRVVSPQGGIPSTQTDPANMSDKETRSLVAQILAQAQQE